jgi:hypothetical protein
VKDIENTGRWLVVLVGGRGFELGEHGRVGAGGGHLFAELLHVPMLWRFPDGTGALARSPCLSSHLDLGPTLLDWVRDVPATANQLGDGLSLLPLARDDSVGWRDVLMAANSEGDEVLRTADWCLRRGKVPIASDSSDAAVELFVRPDDRWEANNVASLCQDEVAQLSEAMDSMAERYRSGEPNVHAILPSATDTGSEKPASCGNSPGIRSS